MVPQVVDGLHGVRDHALDRVAARLWDAPVELLEQADRRGTPARADRSA